MDAETLCCAKDVHPIASVEMEYSLFNRSMEQTILPTARELGIDVVAFGILAHGLLSGAWTKGKDIIPIISVSKLSQFNASILAREIVTHEEVEHIEQTVPVAAISGRSFPN